MSRKSRRNKNKNHTAINGQQQQALNMFLEAMVQVEQEQGYLPTDKRDLSVITKMIAENPQVAYTLDMIRQRQEATKEALSPDLTLSGSGSMTHPQAEAINGGSWTGDDNAPVGVSNAKIMRQWAEQNEWVRAAINIRRGQVEAMRPICAPADPKKRYNKVVMQKMNSLIRTPNKQRDSWRSFIGPILEDSFALDRGAFLKNMTVAREPVELWYEDGSTISIYPEWSGDAAEPRYLYISPDKKIKKALRNDECVVMMQNTATYRYGLSIIQSLQKSIEADLAATASAANLMLMKPPPHAIQIPKMSDTQLQKIVTNYNSKIAGKKQLFWFGGQEVAHLFPLMFSAKDNQWLEYQVYLLRKIATLFQLSPQKFGMTMDINRANGEAQQEIDEDRGLIPLLLLIEEYMNVEVLADFAPKDSDGNTNIDALNLKVYFPQVSDAQRKLHAKDTVSLAAMANPGLPSMTLNMILAMLGEEPVEGGDTFYSNTANGPVKWLSYDEPVEDMIQNQPKPEPVQNGGNGNNGDTNGNTSGNANGNTENDDSNSNTNDTNSKGKNENKQKVRHYAQYDFRVPGGSWYPDVSKGVETQKIPQHLQGQHIPDKNHAQEVLKNHLQKLFDTVAEKGLATIHEEDL